MNDEITYLKALECFNDPKFWEILGKVDMLVEDKKDKYRQYLDNLIDLNEKKSIKSDKNAHFIQKGKALEALVHFLLENSGYVYKIHRNLRTSTNEIDDIVELNEKGCMCYAHKHLDFKGTSFLCECKNYHKKISVTYVGKFCHLLLVSQKRLGILFSFYGVTGNDWNDASGLIKKFHLFKENPNERFYVLDFNISDFKRILEGQTFYDIIKAKCLALETDTNYTCFLTPHPAENNLN